MMISEAQLAGKAAEAVRAALQGVPRLSVRRVSAPRSRAAVPDLVVQVKTAGATRRLILETKSRGEPRLAREAANQLLRFQQDYRGAYGVFAAPYVSQSAAELCRSEGIGYLDFSGNCRLAFDGIFIERQGRPNAFAERRGLRSLYSPKAARVLSVLLSDPCKGRLLADAAAAAAVSIGLVSKVKKLLADREWLSEQRRGLSLRSPGDLLADWSAAYSFRRNTQYDYYSLDPPAEVESNLAALCADRGVRYGLTLFSAAARMAPAVPYQRAFAYVDGPIDEIARALGLKQVATGANVTLLAPYDAGVFIDSRDFEGIATVSPIQTYLDLAGYKGRGVEAAETLLKEVIEPSW